MGYLNISYFIGKTPINVFGPKSFESGQEADEVGQTKNFSAFKSGFFNFQLNFAP